MPTSAGAVPGYVAGTWTIRGTSRPVTLAVEVLDMQASRDS